jgi:oligogalacturonide transporter
MLDFEFINVDNRATFEIIKKEIARRKGEDASTITEEEKRACEKVTGFKYEDLWNLRNTRMGS